MKYWVALWAGLNQDHSAARGRPLRPHSRRALWWRYVPWAWLRFEDLTDTHSYGFWRLLIGQFPALYRRERNPVHALEGLAFIRALGQMSQCSAYQCQGQSSYSSNVLPRFMMPFIWDSALIQEPSLGTASSCEAIIGYHGKITEAPSPWIFHHTCFLHAFHGQRLLPPTHEECLLLEKRKSPSCFLTPTNCPMKPPVLVALERLDGCARI